MLINWKLNHTTQNLKDLKFSIDRGEGPTEMEVIKADIPGSLLEQEFVDETVNLFDLEKTYYYRIRAIEMKSGTPVQTFESGFFHWAGPLDLVALYIIEEHLFEHEHVNGSPVAVFKKRKDSQQCPDCWDPILQRVTRSGCLTCMGTGKLEGYYPPYFSWMKFEPDPKVAQVADWGLRQSRQTDIQFTNFPILSVGDIIVELAPNRYFRIANVRFTEKNRVIMLQVARMDEVNPTDVENELEVPGEQRSKLVEQFRERADIPEF